MSRLDGILRRISAMGILSVERHWALIPPDLAKRVRPRVVRVGDGIATMLEKSDALRMNRVIGLGHRGIAKEAMIDELIEHYRAARIERFSFLLALGPQTDEISRWLLKRDFTRHIGYRLLLRDTRKPVPTGQKGVRVARAGRKDWATAVRIHGDAFGTPASRIGWNMAAAALPTNESYLAFVGAEPAGAGNLRVEGDLAWLGGGATRTRWRRRGVHGALIAARLRRAARLGCRWAWTETIEPRPGRPDGSRRNMIRLGFEEIGTEPIFVWQDE